MKTKIPVLALVAAVLAAGCSSTEKKTSGGATVYPFKTCIVTGNTLGSMGDTVTEVFEGREIKFCCEPCVRKFHKNPAKYLAKLPN